MSFALEPADAMSDPDKSLRLYDEKEVGKLLKRATEIQREEPVRAATSGGLSLHELQEIAAEAGIDPRHLQRAAMEMDSGDLEPSFWARFLGEPPTVTIRASVPGEMPVSEFEGLVPVIQQATRVAGQPSLLGRTLTWHAEIGFGRRDRSINVTVATRDGETHIQAEERLGPVALAMFAGGMGGAGMGLGMGVGAGFGLEVLGSALFAVLAPVGAVSLAYIAAREVFGRFARSRRRVMVEVMDRLVREVTAAIAAASLGEAERPLELPRG